MADGMSFGNPVLIKKPGFFQRTPAPLTNTLLQTPFFSDDDFRRDMANMILGKHCGDGLKYILTDPTSFDLYADFNKASLADEGEDYYVSTRQIEIIRSNVDFFRELGRKHGNQLVLTELGTGTGPAIENLTFPLVEALKPSHYVGIDYSIQSAFSAATMVDHKFTAVQSMWFHHDFNQVPFNRDHKGKEWNRPMVVVQLGSTLGNVAGRPGEGLPRAHVMAALKNYRGSMQKGDHLILGLDQNQDAESLHKCYGMESIERFGRGLLRQIHNDVLHQRAFTPDDFEYVRAWHPESHLYTHSFVAKKPMLFSMEGQLVHFEKGQGFTYCNSYKYPQEFLDEVFPASGFKPIARFPDPKGQVHLHVLEAA